MSHGLIIVRAYGWCSPTCLMCPTKAASAVRWLRPAEAAASCLLPCRRGWLIGAWAASLCGFGFRPPRPSDPSEEQKPGSSRPMAAEQGGTAWLSNADHLLVTYRGAERAIIHTMATTQVR
jgi:hypothetical protein